MSDGIEQDAAMESLRAPAGRDVVERVTAERLAPSHLRAVDADTASEAARIAQLESELNEERAARRKAESVANEMAVLVARVRTELSQERDAREAAEATAGQMAGLVAKEHERTRQAEEDLRLAWAQVPMFEQQELSAAKPTVSQRAMRALGR